MSKISVQQPHSLSRPEAKARLAGFEELLKKYRISLAWNGDKAMVKGVGLTGDVNVGDAAVDVSLKLGMIARAAGVDAKRLEGSIARRLKEAFEE